MILREIEFDLPYRKNFEYINSLILNSVDYDNAVRQDYNKNWKQKRRDFSLMTRCITSMIERIAFPIKNSMYRKIIVEVVDHAPVPLKNYDGIAVIQIKKDYDNFFLLSDLKKKKWIISILNEIFSDKKNKNVIPNIDVIISNIKKTNYTNYWCWKTINYNNKHASIFVNHDVKTVEIILKIFKEDVLIKKDTVISCLPDERVYSKYLKGFKWISDKEILLTGADYTCNIE